MHRARRSLPVSDSGALRRGMRAFWSSVQMSQSTPNRKALPHSEIIDSGVRPFATSPGSTPRRSRNRPSGAPLIDHYDGPQPRRSCVGTVDRALSLVTAGRRDADSYRTCCRLCRSCGASGTRRRQVGPFDTWERSARWRPGVGRQSAERKPLADQHIRDGGGDRRGSFLRGAAAVRRRCPARSRWCRGRAVVGCRSRGLRPR